MKPCIKCGSTERYKSGDCKVCARRRAIAYQQDNQNERNAYKRQWRKQDYANTPDKYREYKKLYRANHLEQEKARQQQWYAENGRHWHAQWRQGNPQSVAKSKESAKKWRVANPEKAREATRRWKREHREQLRHQLKRRRAQRVNAEGKNGIAARMGRAEVFGYKCWICQVSPAEAMDHVFALCNGGSDWPANLRPVCTQCNGAKGGWEQAGKKSLSEIMAWVARAREVQSLSFLS